MAIKLQRISELMQQTVSKLTENQNNWTGFLKTSAQLYKYPFQEQVQVYVQRPDATACASIELWNKRIQRWVNRGAKGIALIDDSGTYPTLKHVFDVSDTHSLYNIPFKLWEMNEAYQPQIIEELSDQFGDADSTKDSFEYQLASIAQNAIEDNYAYYFDELVGVKSGSSLEDMEDDKAEVIFKEALAVSITYGVLLRLDIDADLYFEDEAFDCVKQFNTFDTIIQLGCASSDISEMVLRQIERTVKSIEKQERDRLAKAELIEENKLDDEKERSVGHGDHIHEAGRLPDTRPDAERAGNKNNREIRDVEEDFPQEQQERDVFRPASVREAKQPFSGHRSGGEGAGGDSNGKAPKEEPGAGQGDTADGLGGAHEQYQTSGGGSGTEQSDLQLEWHDRETEDSSLPFFHSTKLINELLRTTPHLKATKQDIAEFYAINEDDKECTEYIKSVFNNDYTELLIDDKRVGYKTYRNVLHLWEGSYASRTAQGYYDWGVIAGYYGSMILLNEFLDEPPKLPTQGQQIALIKQAEDEKSSAFSIPQEAIDSILRQGSGVQDGKYRIYLQFQQKTSAKENADFLKNEYGIGGRTPALVGTDISEWHDGKGITLTRGSINEPPTTILLTWAKIQKRICELIADKRYMSQSEIDAIPAYEQRLMQQQQKAMEERAASDANIQRLQTARAQGKYNIPLGSTVYVEQYEYEVSSIDDDTVVLFDPNYPLIQRDIPRDSFIRELQDSSRNDYLLDLEVADEKNQTDIQLEVGMKMEFDGRKFIIDSINMDFGKVSLRDISFEQTTGFPIFRSESIEMVQWVVSQQPAEKESSTIEPASPTAPEWVKEGGEAVTITREGDTVTIDNQDDGEKSYVEMDIDLPEEETEEPLHPLWEKSEVPKAGCDLVSDASKQTRVNYHITNDELGHGGAKTKYGFNADAIRTLKQIESENRLATPKEQQILSQYVGWGGLPQAFDTENSSWSNEYLELKQLLTEDEYNSARESTLNAHYTSPVVIKAIYRAIENMGFKTGNVLEPACGIGNFFGLIPDSMKDAKLYGMELDSITGRIAKQLYQNAKITVEGYEKTNLPDSFFDLAIGNVPFGSYGVADKRYDKNHFLIHDYFFAKTLDKVRPGGIIAFITSKGTMDKKNTSVRKYIAQRADLIGAIRLPNDAFYANAGTQVTSDILFLQKRDRVMDIDPDWVHLGQTEDGIPINRYFVDNPDMVLGIMTLENTMYGNAKDTTCVPYPDTDLSDQLRIAIENIHAQITEYEYEDIDETEDSSIPADPNVRNFSFTLEDGELYFRENSRMNRMDVSVTASNRIRGMIEIRDCTRRLIQYQLEGYSDETIEREQNHLNILYDDYTKKYGLLNSRANNMAFSDDSSYCLLCSLEVIDDNGELKRKADMFSKRTIKQHAVVTSVDTADEALAVSLAEKACVDMAYMSGLVGISEEQIAEELSGVIFHNPISKRYETSDEYLSGNVREKLKIAKGFVDSDASYQTNVAVLETVQPKDLTASEIDVRLGAAWISAEYIEQFIFELLKPSYNARNKVRVHYSPYTAAWFIDGKRSDYDNVAADVTYGTKRINAYKIIEETLNLKDVRIFDKKVDVDGKETRVLNRKETMIAQQKQQAIKDAFRDWIWKEHERRETLVKLYNEKFNSVRPREYDGSHIRFSGINPEITLYPHQVNAVAHILYGGNTLLAHVVGAGKTFEMVAAAMESKRLGLCQKSLFVVPNHLTEQWASEFLQLYPSANILVATRKDFEMRNRKKFCGRIATGDYDAVIIGHSQFERIPMSIDRQCRLLEKQLEEITDGIRELKESHGERYSIKQMEKVKKSIKLKLDKLNDSSRKDDVVTFEELGVDRLFVDEAHSFKNLFLYTKMRNVAGLAQTEAQKSSDLFMKTQYLDELTGGRGTVFATGTPISNSMVEMYTMQRYLQYETLRRQGLHHFDAWASTFGETVTAIELAPEGTGYRAKTRFARFYNLPELLSMFKEVADIQTADMLDLEVPKAEYHNMVIKPSEHQKNMVSEFAERAERVRNGMVDAAEDNMLKITNDGRKLALDQRLTNELLPDDKESKVSVCVENIYRVWEQNRDERLTQLVFSDLSTPHYDGSFNVYDDMKKKLMERGVPEEEIAYIHDAKTEVKKSTLFSNVRKGQVRILLGSTFKMGAGTNVQNKLYALHHLDVPWRPSDIEQREGRLIRQGNGNDEVHVYRYVTENTFDSYMWQTIENKQKFISQIMTSKSPVRSCEDIDETSLSYAEVKALATGNPHIKEKMDLEIQVSRLKLLKSSHMSQRYAMEDNLVKHYPTQIHRTEERIRGYEKDLEHLKEHAVEGDKKFYPMVINGYEYTKKGDAGKALLEACKKKTSPDSDQIGTYRGFEMALSFDTFAKQFQLALKNALSHSVDLGSDVLGNITRIDNAFAAFPAKLDYCRRNLDDLHRQVETAKQEVEKPFVQEKELKEKSQRLAELDALLNMDERENEIVEEAAKDEHKMQEKTAVGYER